MLRLSWFTTSLHRVLPCCLLVLMGAIPVWGEAPPEIKHRLLEDAKHLASDAMEGRAPGSGGINQAADFVRVQFAKAGLVVDRINGDARQKFDLTTGAKLTEPNSLELIGPDGKSVTLKMGDDYEACSFGGSGSFEAEVVFCGYGIEAKSEKKEESYDDFEGVDVKGKVVIFLRRSPRQNDMGSAHSFARHQDLRSKMNHAATKGAAAVLFVNDVTSGRKAAEKRREDLAKANEAAATAAETFLGIDAALTDKVTEAKNGLTAAVNQVKSVKNAIANANDDALMKFGYAGHGDTKPMPPAVHLTQKRVNEVLAGIGKKLEVLERDIDSDGKPRSQVVAGWKARGTLSMEKVKTEVFNVIGVIEGEGPLADETVVVGAHYDHVGRGGSNSLAPNSTEIHNGADDNASGTVTLLELARRFGTAAKTKRPARRIVFIAFTGEELGLLGSARYCKEPLFPLEKTVAMFNMDMVGRLMDEKLIVYGTGTSPRWEPHLKEFNGPSPADPKGDASKPAGAATDSAAGAASEGTASKDAKADGTKADAVNANNPAPLTPGKTGFKLIFKPEGFGPSDHSSFYAKKIPVLHFFTGDHPDYHRPTDDWEKLNIEGMARVTDLIEKMVSATVDAPDRPAYVEVKGNANIGRGGDRPYFGSIPEFGNEEPGYAISAASPGSPADKAGLKGGDRIIKLGGHAITGLDDFDAALRKFKGGDTVDVIVVRDKKEVMLQVKLGEPK